MRYFLISALLLTMWVGCSKKNEPALWETATIEFTGDYAVDGCGFWISIDKTEYKPTNEEVIPDRFKTLAPTTITFSYELTADISDYQCGLDPTKRTVKTLRIMDIE